jgi:triphosphoribosyl-dephospho-CoA synthetase
VLNEDFEDVTPISTDRTADYVVLLGLVKAHACFEQVFDHSRLLFAQSIEKKGWAERLVHRPRLHSVAHKQDHPLIDEKR